MKQKLLLLAISFFGFAAAKANAGDTPIREMEKRMN